MKGNVGGPATSAVVAAAKAVSGSTSGSSLIRSTPCPLNTCDSQDRHKEAKRSFHQPMTRTSAGSIDQ
jgi:hypothetical protein